MTNEIQEQAFIEMLEQYKRVIYKVCYLYAESANQLNDYYQEVVINLWQGYPKFRGESKTSTWVYRISLFTCISFLRRNKAKPEFIPLSISHDVLVGHDPEDEQLQLLYTMITRLGKLDKALILLWLEEKTYEEIAEITGISRNNVAVKLMRIKNKLKTMCNE